MTDTWARESRPERVRLCVHTTEPTGPVPEPFHCDHIARWSARSGTTGRSGTGVNTGARLRSGTVPVPKLWCEHGLRCPTSLHWKCVTCRGLHHPLLGRVHTCSGSRSRVPVPFRSRSGPVPVPFRSRSGPVPVPFRSRSGPVPVPFRSRSGPVPVPFRSRSGPVPVPFRSRSTRSCCVHTCKN